MSKEPRRADRDKHDRPMRMCGIPYANAGDPNGPRNTPVYFRLRLTEAIAVQNVSDRLGCASRADFVMEATATLGKVADAASCIIMKRKRGIEPPIQGTTSSQSIATTEFAALPETDLRSRTEVVDEAFAALHHIEEEAEVLGLTRSELLQRAIDSHRALIDRGPLPDWVGIDVVRKVSRGSEPSS